MDTLELYRPIIIADPLAYNTQHLPARSGCSVAIPIAQGPVDRDMLHRFMQGNDPFLFLYTTHDALAAGYLADEVKLCFFSSNYLKEGNAPVIAFTGMGEISQEILFPLTDALEKQGWLPPVCWQLSELSLLDQIKYSSGDVFVARSSDDVNSSAIAFLSNPLNINKYIMFQGTAAISPWELERQFNAACSSFLQNDIVLKDYAISNLLLLNNYIFLTAANKSLLERLHNAEQTIEIIRSKYKGDYDILFNWYQKEYEVLPLWFKRLGHVVKFLMGKRSFKSLYSDDESRSNGHN